MLKNKQAEIIKKLTHKELIQNVIFSQCLILILAFMVGLFLFPSFSSFSQLLTVDFFWIAIGFMSGLIIVGLDILFMNYLPKKYYDDGGINEKIFSSLSKPKIVLLTIVIAIAEEVLFRGVLQTHIGLWMTSLIFGFIHVRYLSHWFLFLNVMVLSFWLGLIYSLSNHQLLPVIIMHFTIDCLLGLIIQARSSQLKSKEGM